MGYLELIIIGLGLSVDSFAVSVCAGLVQKRVFLYHALRIGAVLGIIQGVAPVIGGVVGVGLKSLIQTWDHWIALILLVLIGLKMIYDGLHKGTNMPTGNLMKLSVLISMGAATSLDALVVGVSLGIVGVNLWIAGLIIAITTFVVAMTGILLGARFVHFKRLRLEIIAGLILIGIGIKIFIEHLINHI